MADRNRGASMKKRIGLPGFLVLVWIMATSVFCQNVDEEKISDEEYGIYTLVMGKIGGASSVNSQTLQGLWAGYQLNDLMRPINPDPELVRNFDEKNRKKYQLSESFVQEPKKEPVDLMDGKRQISFSRVGFDLKKNQGLLVVGLTYAYPEDVMNEGKFVFLNKKDGQWVVDKTTEAWDMRLGTLH
jgi:hypothetical protein